MIERAEQLHRQFFQPVASALPAANWEPPIDMFESEQGLTVIAALPGVDPADLSVSLEPGLLTVAGVRRQPASAHGAAIRRLEIPYGRFERRVRLPAARRWEVERSSLENGCLRLALIEPR